MAKSLSSKKRRRQWDADDEAIISFCCMIFLNGADALASKMLERPKKFGLNTQEVKEIRTQRKEIKKALTFFD